MHALISQIFFALIALTLTTTEAAADTIYKVVAPDGTVTYTTVPPTEKQKGTLLRMDVPAPEASKAGPPVLGPKPTNTPKRPDPQTEPVAKSPLESVKDALSGILRTKAPSPPLASGGTQDLGKPILFYKGTGCEDCDAARRYLNDKGIAFRGFDVNTEGGRRAMGEFDRSARLPLLVAAGKRVQGYSMDAYEELLSRRQ